MSTVGVCLVIYNANYAVQLCIESLRRYHPDIPLYIGVNLSQDGAKEFAQPYAKYFHEAKGLTHGRMLDHLCKQVEEDYILIIDSDVEFTTSCIDKMVKELEDNDAFCICRPDWETKETIKTWEGETFIAKKRIDPSCALFRKDQLLKILDVFSFTLYSTLYDKYNHLYDTAAMITNVARLMGLKIMQEDWIHHVCPHYGSISFIPQDGTVNLDDPATQERLRAYETIKKRLNRLKHPGDLDGMIILERRH